MAGSEVEKTGRILGCVVVQIVARVEVGLGRRGEAGDEVTQLGRVGAAVGQADQGRLGGGADILPPSQADLLQGREAGPPPQQESHEGPQAQGG